MKYWRKGVHKEQLRGKTQEQERVRMLDQRAEEATRIFHEVAMRLGQVSDEAVQGIREFNEKEFQDRFLDFTEQLTDGVIVFNIQGKIMFMNHVMESILGLPRSDDWIYRAKYADGDIAEIFSESILEPDSDPSKIHEYQIIRADNKLIEVEVSLSRITLGEQMMISAIVRDITEKKELQRVTEEHRTLLQTVFDVTPHPVFVKDSAGRIIDVNSAFIDFTGLDKDHVIGKTAHELYSAETAAEVEHQDEIARSTEGTHRFRGTFQINRPFRGDYFRKRFKDGSGYGIVGSFQDLTELLDQADALTRSRDILEVTSSAARRFLFKDRTFESTVVHILKKLNSAMHTSESCIFRLEQGKSKKIYTTCCEACPMSFQLSDTPDWRTRFERFEIISGKVSELTPDFRNKFCQKTEYFIAVPLFLNQELDGFLMLKHEQPRVFSDDELTALKSMAGTFAGAFERIHHEKIAHERAELHTMLNRISPVPLMSHDGNTIIEVNPEFLQQTGATYDQVKDSVLPDWIHPDDLSGVQKTVESENDVEMFVRFKNTAGEYAVFCVHSSAAYLNSQVRVLCFMSKISRHDVDHDLDLVITRYRDRNRRASD